MTRSWRYQASVAIFLGGSALSPAIVMAHGPQSEGTYVTTAQVDVKAGPSHGSETVRKFRKATTFEIVGKEGAWLKVQLAEHGDHFGYIDVQHARIKDHHVVDTVNLRPAIPAAYVIAAPISVRQGPGEDFPVISTRPQGAKIVVLGMEGDWLRIASRRGDPPEYVERKSTFLEHAD